MFAFGAGHAPAIIDYRPLVGRRLVGPDTVVFEMRFSAAPVTVNGSPSGPDATWSGDEV
jgi:hypothetical protein